MSEEQTAHDVSDQSHDVALLADDVGDSKTKDQEKVDYRTYSKVLTKLKKLESSYKDLEGMAEDLKREKFEAEGNKDEALKSLKDQLRKKDDELSTTRKSYGFKVISSQVESAARTMGCVDTEALMKLMDFSQVMMDEDFNVDDKSLKVALEDTRKKRKWLFETQTKTLADGVPSSKPKVEASQSEKLAKMSAKDIIEAVRAGKL